MSAPTESAEPPVSPITEEDLSGLPPRALVALVARAAWRSLPLYSGRQHFSFIVAGITAADLVAVGQDDSLSLAVAAVIQDATEVPAPFGGHLMQLLNSVVSQQADGSLAALVMQTALSGESDGLDAEATASYWEAARLDLVWLRDWSGQQRVADGLVGPDFFTRPLWLTSSGEAVPENIRRTTDSWDRGAGSLMQWLVPQFTMLLKGGGLDVESHMAFLGEWYREHQQDMPASEADADPGSPPVTKATKTATSKTRSGKKPPPDAPFEQEEAAADTDTDTDTDADADTDADTEADSKATTEQQEEPPPELLPTGIVTASADSPAFFDHLGRKPLVETLADMLSSPDQDLPMTIALLGDWGSGKSSVLEQLKWQLKRLAGEQVPDSEEELEQSVQPPPVKRTWREQLVECWRGLQRRPGELDEPGDPDHCRYLCAEFNAWEYEQTDNVRAGLAQEVVRGLTGDLSKCEKLRLAFSNAATQHGVDFYLTVVGLLLIGVLGVLGVLVGPQLSELNDFNQSLLGTGGAAILVFSLVKTWQKMMRFLEHPLADKLSTYLRLPDYGSHLGEIPIIKREIEGLCDARLDVIPNGRLLVIVDDLDRCHPDKVIETLDAIRLVMNLKRVAVIVAIDDRIAFRAVADHYKALAEDGKRSKEEIARDYLGKIIQLPVNLYQPWPWEVKDFINHRLFKVESPAADQGSEKEEGQQTEEQTQEAMSTEQQSFSAEAAKLVAVEALQGVVFAGSGQDGRVLKKDVEAYLAARPAADGASGEGAEGDTKKEERAAATTGNPAGPEAEGTEGAAGTETAETEEAEAEAKAQERREQMKDTHAEMILFTELARDMNFHNPRQLIRLRNSYRLLKGYRQSREKGPVDIGWVRFLMHGLFWYEFLYQQKLSDRQAAEAVAWTWAARDWEMRAQYQEDEAGKKHRQLQEAGDKRAEQLANPPVVNMSRRLSRLLPGEKWTDGYPGLMQTVEMVVLPNAQMGLMLRRSEVRELLEGKSTDARPVEIDPWNLRPIWNEEKGEKDAQA